MIIVIIVGYLAIGFVVLMLNKPTDMTDGVLLLMPCLLGWPLLVLGWLVSRPFA